MKRGIFEIRIDDIEKYPEQIKLLMGQCIILRAECLYVSNTIEYVALNNNFKEVPPNVVTWNYNPIIIISNDNTVIEWKEIDEFYLKFPLKIIDNRKI